MASQVERFLDGADVTQTEIAHALGLDPSTVSRKVAGSRPWKLDEIQKLLAFLSQRLGRPVSYNELLADADSEPSMVGRAS